MVLSTKKSGRGFSRIEFQDAHGDSGFFQISSLIGFEKILIGRQNVEVKKLIAGQGWQPYRLPNDVRVFANVYLDREQVEALLPYLQHFVETGDLFGDEIAE